MTKISSLTALTGAGVDTAADLIPIVDMSLSGSARNKKILVSELGNALASALAYTNEQAQDAIGAMVDGSLTYVDATPLLQRAALTGDVTASAGSNATAIANNAVSFGKFVAAASAGIVWASGAGNYAHNASGGGTTNFLRADGTWAAPPGSGGSFTAASTTEQLTGTDSAKGSTSDSVAALWEQGADVASAGTTSLGEGGYFNITGTTTITDIDFATDKAGRKAWVKFAGVLTLTHNASTLILPTGANIATAAGDTACFVSEGSDVVRCVAYTRASGAALASSGSTPWDFSPPLAATFPTFFNQDGTNVTLTDDSNVGLLIACGTTGSTDDVRGAVKALPSSGSAAFSAIAKIIPNNDAIAASGQNSGGAIVLRESATDKVVLLGQLFNCRVDAYRGTKTAYTAAIGTAVLLGAGLPTWYRIDYDGAGTYTLYQSADGKGWTTHGTVAATTAFTTRADQIGFGFTMNLASHSPRACVPYWSLT